MRYVLAALLACAFAVAGLLIGGTRPVFSLPAYALLAGASLVALILPHPDPLADRRCLVATAALFSYVLLRQLTSPVEYLARFDLLLVLASLLVYSMVSSQLIDSRYRWCVVALLLVLAFGNIALAAFQFLTGTTTHVFGLERPAHYGTRASGFYICPNHLAGFLEVTVLFASSVALWSRRALWLKVLVGYIGALGLAALLLTGSRGGMAAMAVGLAVFLALSLRVLWTMRPEKFRAAATLAGITALGLVGLTASFVAGHYFLQARSITVADDTNGRLALWQTALQQFTTSPAFGTGSGTFYIFGPRFRDPAIQMNPEYAHNDYLQFLAEFGVVGFLFLVVFLFTHWRSGWRSVMSLARERRHSSVAQSDRLAFGIAALSAIAACAIHSGVDFNLHIPVNGMLMALCFGVAANVGVTRGTKDLHPKTALFARCIPPALALWMLLAGVRTWPAEYYGERARLALRNQQYPAGAALATRALQHDKTNPFVWLYLGQAHAEMAATADAVESTNSWLAAIEAFSSGLELFPQERWLLLGMAEALDALGRFTEAESYFQTAIGWDPNSAEVRALYAMHLAKSGRVAEAEEHFKRSLALRYTFAAAHGLERLTSERTADAGAAAGK